MSETNFDPSTEWLAALRQSQQRLAEIVSPMTATDVERQSYASEWSIAQVMSHLGSGATIFGMFIDAGRTGSPSPAFEQFQPVWDRWNAKSPHDQAADGLGADAAFVDDLEALDEAQRTAWELDMFGSVRRLTDVMQMRLGEHALHSWDIAVTIDQDARLSADAIALLIDRLGELVARAGKTPEQPIAIAIETTDPARSFRLDATGEALALTPQESGTRADGDAMVRLPAEAMIRLFYGRLDPEHTPPIDTEGIDIDTLRTMFPGV